MLISSSKYYLDNSNRNIGSGSYSGGQATIVARY